MRRMIREADPDAVESIKWRKAGNPSGVPVWEHAGILCTGETYKQYIKLTFARGASLDDPKRLFNSSLTGVPAARSTSAKASKSTKPPSRRWCARPSRSTSASTDKATPPACPFGTGCA